MPSVLFVCTANRFRSVLCAQLFQKMLFKQGINSGWQIKSAGTWTVAELPPPPPAMDIGRRLGVSLNEHRTKPVSRELLLAQDLILTMERGQVEALSLEFPEVADRVLTLAEAVDGVTYDIPDPKTPLVDAWEIALDLARLIENGFDRIRALALAHAEQRTSGKGWENPTHENDVV